MPAEVCLVYRNPAQKWEDHEQRNGIPGDPWEDAIDLFLAVPRRDDGLSGLVLCCHRQWNKTEEQHKQNDAYSFLFSHS